MLLKGGDAVVEVLKREGVDTIFGYPGGVALPLYDALYESGIRHILTRHEQGAAHAADGYARASGKVGVCLSTSGPGATNLITGIATANMDSVPMVVITCQVTTQLLGKDSFQEADVYGITTPISKHNFMVKDPKFLPDILSKAFYIARSGRPGPVVVDIPKDLFFANIEIDDIPHLPFKGYNPIKEGKSADIDIVIKALAEAKRPLLFIGGGVVISDMSQTLAGLLKKTNLPVIASLLGLSAVDHQYDNYLGMVGMHGTYAANMAISNCDLLLAMGVRFDDRVTGDIDKFAPNTKIAHFDIDPSEIGKIIGVDYSVLGDLSWSLPQVTDKAIVMDISEWLQQLTNWKTEHPLKYNKKDATLLPQEVIEGVSDILADDAIVVTDVGQHQMWAAQYCRTRTPRGFLSSGGLGTMGYGLPAAIGAQIACPDQEVWLFVGDGGIMMNCQELATASEHNLPIKIFVINNHGLGMVRQWQRMFFQGHYSASKHYAGTDFAAIAWAMGVQSLTVKKKCGLKHALEDAKNSQGPILIDVWVEDDENVLPMVAPGAPLTDMME